MARVIGPLPGDISVIGRIIGIVSRVPEKGYGRTAVPSVHTFTENAVYTECYGPEYRGIEQIEKWFADWNKKGRVDRKSVV